MDKDAYSLITTVCHRVPKLIKMDMYNTFITDEILFNLLNNDNVYRLKNIKYLDLSCILSIHININVLYQ